MKSRPYFADYVNHILRFYTRNRDKDTFKCEADRLNHAAAARVFSTLDARQQGMLCEIYARPDSMTENVAEAARIYVAEVGEVWHLVGAVTARIARERELI